VDVELRHLRQIVQIADSGGVAEAARVLGIPATQLAAQLARTENLIGSPIFVPSAGTTATTVRGREVLDLARALLADVAELMSETRNAGGVLRLVGAEFLLTPTVARLAASRPDLVVTTEAMDPPAAIETVRSGDADVAATVRWPHAAWPSTAGLEIREIGSPPLQVMLPEAHPHAGADLVDLGDLAAEVWCVRAGSSSVAAVLAECARHGFEADVRHRLRDDDSIAALVASGQAVSLVADPPRETSGVVRRPYRDAAHTRWVLVWRTAHVPEPVTGLVGALEAWQTQRGWPTPPEGLRPADGAAQVLRLAAVPELASGAPVRRLRTVHGLHATVDVAAQRDIVAALHRRDVDLALCRSYPFLPDGVPLGWPRRVIVPDEPLQVVVSARHRLFGGRARLDELADESWAVPDSDEQVEVLRALCREAGFEPRVVATYADQRDIASDVTAGRLVRLADGGAIDGAALVPIDHPAARRTTFLVWHPEHPAGLLADLVAEEARRFRSMPTGLRFGQWPLP
jgi:DNA-binding transcriptional LysR family regulator